MTKDMTVMTDTTVTTSKYKIVPSPIKGDCTVCWEPVVLRIDLETGKETYVCSNTEFCGREWK
jgi:hypothetical protein